MSLPWRWVKRGDAQQTAPHRLRGAGSRAASRHRRRPIHHPSSADSRTVPVASTTARHAAYHDTPSKIPFPLAYNSPAPLDSKIASKISRLHARRGSASSSSLPRRLASKSLTNLATRARLDDEAASSGVATPAKQRSPYGHLAGRTSIGSPGELDRVFSDDVTMRTATSFGSPAPYMMSPFIPRPRQATPSGEDEIADLPPTLIPIPTFVYRPDATPAKWNPEDPDAPSPFIRRASIANMAAAAAPAQPIFSATGGASSAPACAARPSSRERERTPLSTISPQPPAAASMAGSAARKLPKSRSGNLSSLHHTVLARNAARTEQGLGMGAAVRTRPVGGRDPRC